MKPLALIVFLVCLLVLTPSAHAQTKLLLAHGAINVDVTPLWIAKEQGFFRNYGLDVDLVFIIAGRAAQAMLAGQLPAALIGATHVANAVTAGADLTMVLGLRNRLSYLFVARPSIAGPEDLKNKKLAIGTPAGAASLATYVALDYFGLNPRRDRILLLQVGGEPERLAALQSGSVEATVVSPELAQLVTGQGYQVLLDMGKANIPFQSLGLVFERKLVRSQPELVENMAKAIIEGVAYVHNPANRKTVERTIAKHLRLDTAERIDKAYENLRRELPTKPCPTLRGTASVLKLMAQHGLNAKAAQLRPEDVADLSVCRRLDETGFIDSLYRR